MTSPTPVPSQNPTYQFINVMRFVSAMWVIFSHHGAPPVDMLTVVIGQESWAPLLQKALLLPFSGIAAVIAFFVISGFCIHLPYLSGRAFNTPTFLLQRAIRIGIPLIAAVGVHSACGTMEGFKNIVWSIYCEIIYYLLYPALRPLLHRFGTGRGLAVATVVSWLFCLFPEDGYGHIHAYGIAGTWLVCLPAWLCGCLLAEWKAGTRSPPLLVLQMAVMITSRQRLFLTRAAIWAMTSVILALGMKEILPFKYSSPAFAFVVLVWFYAELARPWPSTWMAKAGAFGYSLYLIHPVQIPIGYGHPPDLYLFALWMFKFIVALAASVVFFLVIERPSHRFASSLAKRHGRPLVQPQAAP